MDIPSIFVGVESKLLLRIMESQNLCFGDARVANMRNPTILGMSFQGEGGEVITSIKPQRSNQLTLPEFGVFRGFQSNIPIG